MLKSVTSLSVLIAFFGFSLLATGQEGSETKEKTPEKAEEKKKEEKVDTTVIITSNDTLQFNRKAFGVKTGEKVKVTLKNIGMLPKVAMGHNLVILKKGVDANAFGLAATKAVKTEYIPAELKDQIFAYTKLLGPKEETDLIFTAPEPGQYTYLCSFPGHFAIMRGIMTVQEAGEAKPEKKE